MSDNNEKGYQYLKITNVQYSRRIPPGLKKDNLVKLRRGTGIGRMNIYQKQSCVRKLPDLRNVANGTVKTPSRCVRHKKTMKTRYRKWETEVAEGIMNDIITPAQSEQVYAHFIHMQDKQ